MSVCNLWGIRKPLSGFSINNLETKKRIVFHRKITVEKFKGVFHIYTIFIIAPDLPAQACS